MQRSFGFWSYLLSIRPRPFLPYTALTVSSAQIPMGTRLDSQGKAAGCGIPAPSRRAEGRKYPQQHPSTCGRRAVRQTQGYFRTGPPLGPRPSTTRVVLDLFFSGRRAQSSCRTVAVTDNRSRSHGRSLLDLGRGTLIPRRSVAS